MSLFHFDELKLMFLLNYYHIYGIWRSKMKKIFVFAYTNFNLGDDLFIKILCERYTDTKFILCAPKDYRKNFDYLNNLVVIPSDSFVIKIVNYILLKLLNISIREIIANTCDGIVNIGGSIFMQSENWKKKIKRRKKVLKRPFFLLGCNFGPFTDENYYTEYKEIFKSYTDVCFRDRYSYELFKELKNVRYASDIIFQLKKNKFKQENNEIAISVIKPSFRKELKNLDRAYYDKIRDIIIYFSNCGYKINLLSFCKNEGDEEAIEEILKILPDTYVNNVEKIFYRNNINDILNVIGTAKYIIATRFHSMIIGWVYNKPVFPIIYNKKMTNVIKDIQFKGESIDIQNISELTVEDLISNMSSEPFDVSYQISDAEKHFAKLDIFLETD